MIIDFEKTIIFHAELDDKKFQDESGNINEDLIIGFCESIDSPMNDENCWIYNDELKTIDWVDSKDNHNTITPSDYENYRREREKAERCYECGGYGDDYDDEGNSLCDDCPFNEVNETVKDEVNLIDADKFIKEFCIKVYTFYKFDSKQCLNILNETKFQYLCVNSSQRIFLFAENPCVFIKDNDLWNYLQNWIRDEYNTILAIGMNYVYMKDDISVKPLFDLCETFSKIIEEK